jgi:hypothetical protein
MISLSMLHVLCSELVELVQLFKKFTTVSHRCLNFINLSFDTGLPIAPEEYDTVTEYVVNGHAPKKLRTYLHYGMQIFIFPNRFYDLPFPS